MQISLWLSIFLADKKKTREEKKKMKKAMYSSFEWLLNKENAEDREQGRAQGKAEDIIDLLEDIGELSEMLRSHTME